MYDSIFSNCVKCNKDSRMKLNLSNFGRVQGLLQMHVRGAVKTPFYIGKMGCLEALGQPI